MPTNAWLPRETTTHQDHVIAHVVGATALGYFIFDEALYLLLDIGFVWTIFLDGEMNLLPHPVAIGELSLDEPAGSEIKADIDLLLSDNSAVQRLLRMKVVGANAGHHIFEIREVRLFEQDDRRLVFLDCGNPNVSIETSLTTAEINVYESERPGI